MGPKPPHRHCHNCGAVARESIDHVCGNCGREVQVLESCPPECEELGEVASVTAGSVRSRKSQPERLSVKRMIQSQLDDPWLQRVHWYLDMSPSYQGDNRKCLKVLKACHGRWEKKQKKKRNWMSTKFGNGTDSVGESKGELRGLCGTDPQCTGATFKTKC